jgi:hypothetical protein
MAMTAPSKSLVAGLVALLFAATVQAQYPMMNAAPAFQVNPALQHTAGQQALLNQALLNQAQAQQTAMQQAGQVPGLPNYLGGGSITSTPYQSPVSSQGYSPGGAGYGGYNPYYPYYPYYQQSDLYQYYQGVAAVTYAYGQYIKDWNKGRLMNQEVERSKLMTQRMLLEEWRYRQSLIPTSEDLREAQLKLDLTRATRQAPIGDILAGKSLNVLLNELKKVQGLGKRGPAIPLDEDMLKQINVAPKQGVNVGFIKTGKINWPIALRGEAFSKFREKIDLNLAEAVSQAKNNDTVDQPLMEALENARKGLEDALDRNATDMSMSQFMEARRYLTFLGEGFRVLAEPHPIKFFNRTYEARGKTVPDLVDYMSKEGLQFVGYVPGGEAAYRMLYTYMLSYYESLTSLASR